MDVNTVGSYTVTYNVTDPNGNAATAVVRAVHVIDTTKPVITLLGSTPVTVECHTGYSDAGASAADSCAGDLSAQILAASTVDVNTVGSYTVTYNVTDPNGNAATAVVRAVHVIDTTKPVITLLGSTPVTVECHTGLQRRGRQRGRQLRRGPERANPGHQHGGREHGGQLHGDLQRD